MSAKRKTPAKKDRLLQVRLESKKQAAFERLMARRGDCMSAFVRRQIDQALAEDRALIAA